MIEHLNELISKFKTDKNDQQLIENSFKRFYQQIPTGEDPWGLNLEKARRNLEYIWPLYKKYFKVRVFGKENVNNHPYIVTSNHTGQIAIDGMLIATAFATELENPRILRSMVERFFTGLPFIGMWAAEGGAVLGDRQNCISLLEKGESVLVFPEGVQGIAKSSSEYYQLQRFTRGFLRIAIKTKTPILPIAVVGAEEIFPFVYQAKGVAKKLGLPALPISANYIPLPSPIDIHIGKEYVVPESVSPDASDKVLDEHIYNIQGIIHDMTEEGLKNRRNFWANQEK